MAVTRAELPTSFRLWTFGFGAALRPRPRRVALALKFIGCLRARLRLSHGRLRLVILQTRAARLFVVRRVVVRLALAKQRDADHADVARPPGACGIGIGELGEIESRDLVETLAPALDADRIPAAENVAALLLCSRLARDHVDAVDARHCQYTRAGRIADAQLVLMTRLACDIKPALVLVDRQRAASRAVVDLYV